MVTIMCVSTTEWSFYLTDLWNSIRIGIRIP